MMLNRLNIAKLEESFDQYLTFWHTDPTAYDVLDISINPIAL
jgi:hypothetical protein